MPNHCVLIVYKKKPTSCGIHEFECWNSPDSFVDASQHKEVWLAVKCNFSHFFEENIDILDNFVLFSSSLYIYIVYKNHIMYALEGYIANFSQ